MPKTKTKKKTNQIVKATRRKAGLKEKLDNIDKNTEKEFIKGYYESRLRIEMSMWKKGKAIEKYVKNRGVNFTLSYYQLEKETGRSRPSLKRWHELYTKHSDMNAYRLIAKKKAGDWTNNAYGKFISKSELTDNKTKQLPEDIEKDKAIRLELEGMHDEIIRLELEEGRGKSFAKSVRAYNAYISICDNSIKLYDAVMAYHSKYVDNVCIDELEKLRLYLNKINHEQNKRFRESINQNQTKKEDKENKCPDCPGGGLFGLDTDDFKECNDCQIWNECDKYGTSAMTHKKERG